MKIILPLLPLMLVFALFETLSRIGVIPAFLFPSPTQVISVLMADRIEFFDAFQQTFMASLIGLGSSVLIGLSTATFLAISSIARKMFYPYAVFFQTVPIIAIAPLLVIWFGYGLPTVVASSFIVSVFPIIANSVNGILSTDPALLQLFKMFGASRTQTLLQLRVPYALPQILTGVKIASGLAVIGAIVGEFISGSGLGGVVDASKNQQRIDKVFAAVLLASVLGILFFVLITSLNRILIKHWHPSERIS